MCVMPAAMVELRTRVKNNVLKRCVMVTFSAFVAFMVIGRILSGVHWITDIIGGALFSTGMVLVYYAIRSAITKK